MRLKFFVAVAFIGATIGTGMFCFLLLPHNIFKGKACNVVIEIRHSDNNPFDRPSMVYTIRDNNTGKVIGPLFLGNGASDYQFELVSIKDRILLVVNEHDQFSVAVAYDLLNGDVWPKWTLTSGETSLLRERVETNIRKLSEQEGYRLEDLR
jgi:hypothetical protein